MLHKKKHHSSLSTHSSFLIGLPILLTIIGLFFIFEASSVMAYRTIGDAFYFFKQQLFSFGIGLVAFFIFSFFDYKKLYYLAFPLMMTALILLVAVLIPGIGKSVAGARRWIDLGVMTFQPTELAKFASILYLCSWFLHKEKQRFWSFLLLLSIIVGLVMIQPDMGTAIVIASIFLASYFMAGEPFRYLLGLVPIGLAAGMGLILSSPYRLKRLHVFLNPRLDPQGIGYHLNQIFISISSGGLFGRGFSESRQKYQFLPEAHTDSIFAIIAEELGFLGGVVLIFLYGLLLLTLYRVAVRSRDRFGQLLVGSIMAVVGLQAGLNLAAMVGLVPLTGIPLPFVSFGGTSLIIFFALMGVAVNVSRRG